MSIKNILRLRLLLHHQTNEPVVKWTVNQSVHLIHPRTKNKRGSQKRFKKLEKKALSQPTAPIIASFI